MNFWPKFQKIQYFNLQLFWGERGNTAALNGNRWLTFLSFLSGAAHRNEAGKCGDLRDAFVGGQDVRGADDHVHPIVPEVTVRQLLDQRFFQDWDRGGGPHPFLRGT